MKSRLMMIAAVFSVLGVAHAANYSLTIDGKDYDLDVGQQQVVKLDDGRSLRVLLNRKDIATFTAQGFSFDHTSALSPSLTNLDKSIVQTIMVSPHGTLVLVQEYASLDPSGLVDLMLNELTKEEVQYGYKITKTDTSKTLSDGTKLIGKVSTSAYKDKELTRYVLTKGGRDSGLLFVTQVETSSTSEEQQIIELFWKSLKIPPR